MQAFRLGPAYSEAETAEYLTSTGSVFNKRSQDDIMSATANELAEGKVVGWFQGRMEFGPRALGSRSILGDPRNTTMQLRMNQQIKFRESFRPFAPVVLEQDAPQYFLNGGVSPYMLFTDHLVADLRKMPDSDLGGVQQVNAIRSTLPAITHLDYSARVQTVNDGQDQALTSLLVAFKEKTGCSVLINTSFNVRGEPIVASPADAYACFMNTDMDCLVIGNLMMHKVDQPPYSPMTRPEADSVLSTAELKHFSRSLALVLVVLMALIYLMFEMLLLLLPVAGTLLFGIGEIQPRLLATPHKWWFKIGETLGRVSTPILLGLVFFLIVTPTGLIKRAAGKDRMARQSDPELDSYKELPLAHSMEDPF